MMAADYEAARICLGARSGWRRLDSLEDAIREVLFSLNICSDTSDHVSKLDTSGDLPNS
jgi:hypothetical protein